MVGDQTVSLPWSWDLPSQTPHSAFDRLLRAFRTGASSARLTGGGGSPFMSFDFLMASAKVSSLHLPLLLLTFPLQIKLTVFHMRTGPVGWGGQEGGQEGATGADRPDTCSNDVLCDVSK